VASQTLYKTLYKCPVYNSKYLASSGIMASITLGILVTFPITSSKGSSGAQPQDVFHAKISLTLSFMCILTTQKNRKQQKLNWGGADFPSVKPSKEC